MNTCLKIVLALSAALLPSAVASAQVIPPLGTVVHGRSSSATLGNTDLGASFEAHALLTTYHNPRFPSADQARYDIGTSATANLFGRSGSIFSARAIADSHNTSGTGNINIAICGYEVLNRNFTTSYSTGNVVAIPHNAFTASISKTFYVDFVPFNLSANIGANLTAGFGAQITVAGAYATGRARGYADANVSFGIGIAGVLGAGIGIQARVMNSDLFVACGCSVASGFWGEVSLHVNPLTIRLYCYIDYIFGRSTKTVANYSVGAIDEMLFSPTL